MQENVVIIEERGVCMANEFSRKKSYLHVAGILAFMFLFGLLPPFGPLTQMGMQVCGIFIGMIWGWTIGETIWPSLLGLVLLGFTEGNTVTGILNTAFANTTLQQVLFSLLFCYGITACGLLELVAKWILSRKFAKRGPYWMLFAFWLAAAVAGAVTTNSLPVTILLWSIFYPIAKTLNLQPKSAYVTIMLVGICVFSYTGAVCVPYCAFANICLGVLYANMPELQGAMNYAAYCTLMIVLNIVLFPAMIGFFKFVVRPTIDYKVVDNIVDPNELHINKMQKIMSGYIVLLCVMMIAPNLMPKTWLLQQILMNLSVNGSFIVVMVLMYLTYAADGYHLMDFAEGMVKGVPWGLYFLLLAALTIAGLITSPATGISTLLIDIVNPFLAGRSAAVFMAIMVIAACIITNCINNVVTVSLLTPISLGFLAINGGSPLMMASLLIIMCLQGVVMPAGSVLGALLHGNTDWLSAGGIYKYSIMAELVLAAVICMIGIPLGNILF